MEGKVRDSLTAIIILGTLLHVVVFTVMIWIRVRRTDGDGRPVAKAKITPCFVCGEPSTGWSYDGLDPGEQVNPLTGRTWSPDMAHYRPVCADHENAGSVSAPVDAVEPSHRPHSKSTR
ncbi:MAG TPA: hypothetical protein VG164_06400 [Trebonia sp.]|jgi:hypothetical protein|nr:hypothetical protein [Trebonia sp.]